MINFDIYQSNKREDASCCYHNNHIVVTDVESLKRAVSKDYVTAKYKDNYREGSNFISANCLPMDIDNDHSDDESAWITLDLFKAEFEGVCFAIQYSRNHMKEKKGKKARPKFHVLFPLKNEITKAEAYKSIRERINKVFPFFDTNTFDSARCLFGTLNPEVEIIDGDKDITEFLEDYEAFENYSGNKTTLVIKEGSRNSTMSKYASRIIKRYGDTDEAKDAFLEIASKCEPPLEDSELDLIWNSATKFYREKVLKSNGYIPPSKYSTLNPNSTEIKKVRDMFVTNDKGGIVNSSVNVAIILENDSSFKNIAYNDFSKFIEITGPVPWEPNGQVPRTWTDNDTSQLKYLLEKRYSQFKTDSFETGFRKVTYDRRFHPVKDFLNSLPKWDGIKRVEDVFIKCLKADDTDYVRSISKKVFAGAVARIYEPGTKFDSILVLDGEQGIGKSTLIKDLVSDKWFTDALALTDVSDKTGAEKIQGYWLIEIGELAGMKKADIEKVKAFISCSDDKYRPSYGRTVERHPRQCIIFATVNGQRGYLRDITGNRRFWIVKTRQKEKKKSWEFDDAWREQFWAEAKELYLKGEKLYLEGSTLVEAEKQQADAMEKDDRVGIVEEYLNTLVPDDWNSMSIYQRRNYLDGDDITAKGTHKRLTISNIEIWCECFKKEKSEMKSADSYAISAIMLQVEGWEKTEDVKKLPIYGRQRVYRRLKS